MAGEAAGAEELEADGHQILAAVGLAVAAQGPAATAIDLGDTVLAVGVKPLQPDREQVLAVAGVDVEGEDHSLALTFIDHHG